MSLLPFLVAAIFLTIAFSNKRAADAKARHWVTVKGKVLEIKSYWTNRKHYAPVVTFYSAHNQQYYFNGKGSRNMLYQTGQLVEVVYNPRDPNQAEVRYDPSDTEMRRLRFMVGGFFLLCAFPLLLIDLVILIGGLMSVISN